MGRRRISEESKLRTTILDLLPPDGQPMRWKELKHRAKQKKLSQSTLSIYLKKFTADGSVKRDVDAQAYPPKVVYRVTKTGKARLLRAPIIKRIQQTGSVAQGQFQIKVGEDVLRRGDEGVLAPRFFIGDQEISVDLLVDKEHGAIAEELLLALPIPRLGQAFATEVYNAMYRLLTKGKNPSIWEEEIDYDRKALDIDITIMIRFNGKKIAAKQDWHKQVQDAEAAVQTRQRLVAQVKAATEQNRDAILKAFIASEFLTEYSALEEEIETIAEKIIEVWTEGGFSNPPSPEEIRGIIDGWRKSGMLESETVHLLGPLTTKAQSALLQNDEAIREVSRTIIAKTHGFLPPIHPLTKHSSDIA